jgi:hypothetical protein
LLASQEEQARVPLAHAGCSRFAQLAAALQYQGLAQKYSRPQMEGFENQTPTSRSERYRTR